MDVNEGYPFGALVFMIAYLISIWIINALMIKDLRKLPDERKRLSRWFMLANIFLASGDTVMGTSFYISYLQGTLLPTINIFGIELTATIAGIFTTSVTMSFYYLFLALYFKFAYNGGRDNWIMWFIYVFFIIRLLMHLNPYNVWFSMAEITGPNYSSWLRNIPLFLYGGLTVLLILYRSYNVLESKDVNSTELNLNKYLFYAMISLVFSYLFYGMDIFFSFLFGEIVIHAIYALKTIAYVVAAIFMYIGGFRLYLKQEKTD